MEKRLNELKPFQKFLYNDIGYEVVSAYVRVSSTNTIQYVRNLETKEVSELNVNTIVIVNG